MPIRPSPLVAALRHYLRALVTAIAALAIGVNLIVPAVLPTAPATAGPPLPIGATDAWFNGQLRDAGIPGAALVIRPGWSTRG